MARNNIKIDSKALEKQLQDSIKRNPKVTANKIKAIALDLAERSALLAPVKTGDLRNNCNADINGVTIFENQTAISVNILPTLKAVAEVGYSLPYALRQHEELTFNHPKGGQAKFLEKPFNDNEQKYIDILKSIPDEVIK
ncbi:MAG: hypothetical protein K2G63_03375 [Oscillospiraceae bacterium]|nr:hypothetical protein [Oscillospiraceae bacterium]